ncbi:hypothetical protein [Hyphococcus lacteus]|uniref:DUF1043 family protein n=1 Tax=Hyphococcus lacteus TaxID=3143536 RepID=A0ABV3Z9U3_9PROT
MGVSTIMSVSGVAEFLSIDVTTLQGGMFFGTLLFFLGSLLIGFIALRASSNARVAQSEAQGLVAELNSQVAEMRDLTAQVERAWQDVADGQSELSAQLKSFEQIKSAPQGELDQASSFSEEEQSNLDAAPSVVEADSSEDKDLSAARSAATEPRSLLRGLLRRG